MAPINILKFPVTSPADTSPLSKLKEAGHEPSQIMAVIGKSEGNGCVNDFSRTLSTFVWQPLIPEDAVTVFSGGTEGVLSPHVSFVVREDNETGLVATVGRTRTLAPAEIGTTAQASEVARTVKDMMRSLGVSSSAVKLVLVKCPLLTSAKIADVQASGRTPATTDTYESMAKSRHESAKGIGIALGELKESTTKGSNAEGGFWSSVSSCSSGAELEDCHILLLASSPNGGDLRALATHMKDAIDAPTILDVMSQVKDEHGQIVQVFAKAEADPSGLIRGNRHTMNTDSDLHSTRHARAAVGGLLAGLTGDTQIYVSGGAEGQGPPGGGSLCIVYRV